MIKIQNIIEHVKYQQYLNDIAVIEQGRAFCTHSLEHFLEVARIGYILWLEHAICTQATNVEKQTDIIEATNEAMNEAKRRIYAASLLHDIGKFRQYVYNENHATASAVLAEEILADVGFCPDQIAAILDAIRNHNQHTSPNMLTRVIQQADRLSRKCYQCPMQHECYKIEQMDTRHGLLY